jgi:hypothetical protein
MSKNSKSWAPIVPPIIEIRDETEEKNSSQFPGTHMIFHVKCTWHRFFEISTDSPLGLPAPPHPTGKTEMRKTGPSVRMSADIHMTRQAVDDMRQNEQRFADIMSMFTSGPASLFFTLGHEIFKFGLAKATNADGSLDIRISPTGATAGGNAILITPDVAMAIIQVA